MVNNQRNSRRRGQRNDHYNRSDSNIKDIINEIKNVKMLKEIPVKDYADNNEGYADRIAKNFKKNINANQLRKFFGAVRLIEQKESWDEIELGFYLLKPQLANAVGRKLVPKPFYNLLMTMMSKVDIGTEEEKIENFKTFTKFFEAIVAYHKFYNETNF